MNPKTLNFLMFCMLCSMIGLSVIALNWKENSIYIKPYAAIKEKRQQLEDSASRPSEQPVAPGFKESEINKVRGDGYSTY